MAAKNPGRFLAPVAIIAVAVAVAVLVRSGVHSGSSHPAPPTTTVTHHAAAARHVASKRRTAFYVIKPGDTLSDISVKTGVPIATLESLNPSIQDPNALQTGVRLRLH